VYVNYMCPGHDQAAELRTAALGILSRLSGWTSHQDDAERNRLVITCQGACRGKIIAALSNAVDNFRVAVPEQATAQPWIVEAAAKSKPGPSATPAARQEQRVRTNAAQQGFMIPATNFQRVRKDINQEFVDDEKEVIYHTFRFNTEALVCLQLAAQSFLQELLSAANLLALHACRVTIFPRDLQLAGMSSAARAHEADRALSTSSSSSFRPASYKPIVKTKRAGAAVSSDQSNASGPSTPSKMRKDGIGEGSSENLALSVKQPRKRKESSEETENPVTSLRVLGRSTFASRSVEQM
jgi:histone H3/H4